ncbi:MAG: hypothetical protein AAF297_04350 [Planctomycetota bacterium]
MSFTGFQRRGEVVELRRPMWSVVVHMTIVCVVAAAVSFPPIGLLAVLILDTLTRGPSPDPWLVHLVMFSALVVVAAGLHSLTLRWRIDLDFERREIRMRGLVWFGPWWRPRFGALAASMDTLRALELVPHPVYPYRGPRRVRLVFDAGTATIPLSFEHRERLVAALSPIVKPTRVLPMELLPLPPIFLVITAALVCLAGAAMVWYVQAP